ncbi:S8 family serine peptidase [Pirellulimonas nuda]|uniref:S8 family serine peptidase n=1 Tax=Pirellulimonas nuda TaxID=2528009 RepID=UPI0018D4748D|nr:S8 family serine peptidase [Pirellulimonas nuda]
MLRAVSARRLRVETLEHRLLLTGDPLLPDYLRPSLGWFGAATTAPLAAIDGGALASTPTVRWVARLTPEAAAQSGGAAGAAGLLGGVAVQSVRGLGLPGQLLIETSGDAAATRDALAANPAIASFHLDASLGGAAEPNDPRFTGLEQYALYNVGQSGGLGGADIDAVAAWDITTGSRDVVVAVIDSGIDYTHPDLAANVWTNTTGVLGPDGATPISHGWDFANNDADPLDDHGHGTHVAGTLGAVGNNAIGVTGVNWAASILPLKLLDQNNTGSVADAIAAVNYATVLRNQYDVNIRVINASWGGVGIDSPGLIAAIDAAGEAGILFVAAAGNGDVFGRGQDIDVLPFFPAVYGLDNMLTVAATDRGDQLSAFSNYGDQTVDLAAPGQSVWSTDLFIDQAQPTQQVYNTRTGTSMAAPHVAGVAALVWSAAPNATMAEVRRAILSGGDPLASLQGLTTSGRRLSAFGAFAQLPPQAAVSTTDVTSIGGTSYQFTATLSKPNNLAGNLTPLVAAASVNDGDFVVRRRGSGGVDLLATRGSTAPTVDAASFDVTYQIIPPGGSWDAVDLGVYDIVLVGGAVADTSGIGSTEHVVGSFTVTSTGTYAPNVFYDAPDANPLDSEIADAAGNVTLRAILQDAANNPLQNYIVLLKPGTYPLTVGGADDNDSATGDLDIRGNVTLLRDGAGEVVIDAGGDTGIGERVFQVVQAAGFPLPSLTLDGITVTGGRVLDNPGGGVFVEDGLLTLRNSTVIGNRTSADGGGVAVAAGASMVVETSSISGNHAGRDGGGVWNAGSATIAASAVQANSAVRDGGGVYNSDIAATDLHASTVSGNAAHGEYLINTMELIGDVFRINDATAGVQWVPKVSVNSSGDQVVAWTSGTGPYAGTSLVVQRYDAAGHPVGTNYQASVAANSQRGDTTVSPDGSFAVVYEVYNAAFTDTEIYAATFSPSGDPISGEILVNTSLSGVQQQPQIASDPSGNYTAVWYSNDGVDGSESRVVMRRFNPSGVPLTGEITVNATTQGIQASPEIAFWDDGQSVVVYTSTDPVDPDYGVLGRLFDAAGNPVGPELRINTSFPGEQNLPNVATGPHGFLVTWDSIGVGAFGQLFDRQGGRIGSEFLIAGSSTSYGNTARVAALADGSYVISGLTDPDDNGPPFNAFARLLGADGSFLSPPVVLSSTASVLGLVSWTDIGVDDAGRVIVTWDGVGPGDSQGIFAQRLFAGAKEIGGDGGGVYNAGTLTATNVTLSGNDAANQGGGLFNADGATAIVESSTVAENTALGQMAGELLSRQGDEFRVNSSTSGTQSRGKLAVNAAGETVVTWTTAFSLQDQDVFAQRYDAFGNAVGGQFQVSDGHISERLDSDAVVLPNGNFAVFFAGWGADQAGWGLRGKVFNAAGTVIAGEYIVNVYQNGYQTGVAIAADQQGQFVAVWHDDTNEGSGTGVFGQRFSQAGGAVGGEFPINAYISGEQGYPRVATWPSGEFVVSWRSADARDPDGGVLARVFNADGTAISGDMPLNSTISGYQNLATVSTNGNGFLAVWLSSGVGVVARMFDRNGEPIGGERLLLASEGSLQWPAVSTLPDGRFIAAWSEYNAESLSTDVYIGVLGALGEWSGESIVVNQSEPFASGEQYIRDIAIDGRGNVTVLWDGSGPDDGAGVFAQRYSLNYDGGGVFNADSGAVSLKNSIVAGNTAAHSGTDVVGQFTSLGNNLIGSDGASTGLVDGVASDQVGPDGADIDARLGPLADNGGYTLTHLPAADSPAIDAGVASALTTDQRGYARSRDGDNNGSSIPDIGAVERYHGSIAGRKFQDQNENGVQDPGEPGLSGWTLYLDLNQNGALDAGEPSTVTDTAGNYTFTLLKPGDYTVAEVNQPGWTRTYSETAYAAQLLDASDVGLGLSGASSIAATADGRFIYVAGAGESKIQRFKRDSSTGVLTPLGVTTSASLVGAVNILQDVVKIVVAPAAALGSVYLYALSSSGALAVFSVNTMTGDLTEVDVVRNGDVRGATVSRLDGSTGLAVSPDGTRVYVSNSGPSALNGGSLLIFERLAGFSPELRFRRVLSNGAGVSPFGTGGRGVAAYGGQVYVVGETADSLDTLTTFNLAAAPFYLNYTSVLRNGQSGVSGLDGANDIAISSDGRFAYVSAATDGSATVFARDTLGALTFLETLSEGDIDNAGGVVRGVQDASSVTISADGSRVYVTGKRNYGSPEDPLLVGAVAVFSRNASSGRLTFLHALADGVPDAFGGPVENLENGVDALATGGFLYVIAGGDENALTQFVRDGAGLDRKTLQVGTEITGADFSARSAPGEIRGIVYSDTNNNGLRDPSESGLAGVSVYLDLDHSNTFTAGDITRVTGPLGEYRFENLAAPGVYEVRLNTLASQTVTSPAPSQQNEWSVDLAPDQVYVGADFLVYNTLSGQGSSQVSGFVFEDLNGNGVPDSGEELANRQVYLDVNDNGVREPSEPVRTTTATGAYSFTGLGATNYVVRLVTTPGESLAGLQGNAFSTQTLNTGPNPLGLQAVDLDGVSGPDLVSVDGGSDKVSVRLRKADGGYGVRTEYAVGDQPAGIAVGDFNNDSYPDIAVVHWSYAYVVFLLGDGAGGFTRAPQEVALRQDPLNPASALLFARAHVSVADLDRDGDDDLVVTLDVGAQPNDRVRFLLNSGLTSPSFTPLADVAMGASGPLSLAVGDLTGDLYPDVVIGNFDGHSVQVLRNNGGTSFTALAAVPVGAGPASVTIAHIGGSTAPDVVGASIGANSVFRLINNGAGVLTGLTPIPVAQGPRSVSVVDIDQDGDADLVVGRSLDNDVVLLRNNGGVYSFPESTGLASFASLVASGVKQVLAADLNGDDIVDLAAVRGDANNGSLAVLANTLAPGSLRLTLNGSNQLFNQNFAVAATAPTLPGDYDRSGTVDQLDYAFWKTHFGATSGIGLQADGNNDGQVDAADYSVWRDRLGQSAPATAAPALASLAEASPSAAASSLPASLPSAALAAFLRDRPMAANEPRDLVFAAMTQQADDAPRRLDDSLILYPIARCEVDTLAWTDDEEVWSEELLDEGEALQAWSAFGGEI